MFKKHRSPVGSRPGTIVAPEEAVRPSIKIILYNEQTVEERSISPNEIETIPKLCSAEAVLWVDIVGLGDAELLKQVGRIFDLHSLALEDVVNVPHRPKAEPYDGQVFVVSQMVTMPSPPKVETEQMSIFIGESWVVTIQEREGDILEPVRKRIRSGKGRIRKLGSDYLGYTIIDILIDSLYPLFEKLGEYLEQLEEELIANPTQSSLERLYEVRREVLLLRRVVYPQRELINSLILESGDVIKDPVPIFLRDCYDHCVQLIDVADNYRELCSSFMDLYLSLQSGRMNEIMKVLTIIATIFIPLSFLAGIYGMNFEYMPELGLKWAYPIFWIIIVGAAAAMLLMFKRAGWLGSRDSSKPN